MATVERLDIGCDDARAVESLLCWTELLNVFADNQPVLLEAAALIDDEHRLLAAIENPSGDPVAALKVGQACSFAGKRRGPGARDMVLADKHIALLNSGCLFDVCAPFGALPLLALTDCFWPA